MSTLDRLLAASDVYKRQEQGSQLRLRLTDLGADVVDQPAIEIRDAHDAVALDDVLSRVGAFDWIVFSSANGVTKFFERLKSQRRDARAVSYTHLRAHETVLDIVCRLLL